MCLFDCSHSQNEKASSAGAAPREQLENGTIIVRINGVCQPQAKPILRELCKQLGTSLRNSNENLRNTRQLGADVIETLNLLKSTEASAHLQAT